MEYLGNKELLTMQKTAFLASGTIACLILVIFDENWLLNLR
jgi:hypothetical protein